MMFKIEPLFHTRPSFGAHGSAQRSVGTQRAKPVAQARAIVNREQIAGLAFDNDIRNAADIGNDDRQSHRHCLQGHHGVGIRTRRQNKHVCVVVQVDKLVAVGCKVGVNHDVRTRCADER